MMLLQQNRIAGDRGLMESANKIDPAYDELIKHDPDLVRKALGEQWERLRSDLGKAIAPSVTSGLYEFAKALASISEAVERHPIATKWILEATAAFAGLAVVLGGVALAVAAVSAIASGGVFVAITSGAIALGAALLWLNEKFDRVGHIRVALQALTSADFYRGIVDYLRNQMTALAAATRSAVAQWTTEIMTGGPALVARTGAQLWALLGQANSVLISWAGELARSVQTDLLNLAVAIGEGLNSLVKNLTSWFAALPGRIWSAVTGSAAPAASAQSSPAAIYAADHPGTSLEAAQKLLAPPSVPSRVVPTLPPPLAPGDIHLPEMPAFPSYSDFQGRVIQPVPPQPANLPPTAQPSTRGTNSDPIIVWVQNQTPGNDIARGVATNMARQMNRPPSGVTGPDIRLNPTSAFYAAP
jgi:hypothetical protein